MSLPSSRPLRVPTEAPNSRDEQDEIVGRVTFADRVAKQTMLSQGAMLKLAGDFRILPELLSAAKARPAPPQSLGPPPMGSKELSELVLLNCSLVLLQFFFETSSAGRIRRRAQGKGAHTSATSLLTPN